MIWLLRDIDLLVTLLRATNLSFEALLLGGVLYLLVVARPAKASAAVETFCLRGIRRAALALFLSELATVVLSSAALLGDSNQHVRDLIRTRFFDAGMSAALLAAALLAAAVWMSARAHTACSSRKAVALMLPLSLGLLATTVATSHAAARLDHQLLLYAATAAHHLGTAAWIGAMPFLLISLTRAESTEEARVMARRYSAIAVGSVVLLVSAGILMAWFYIGSWNGLYGTSYGVLLLAKIYLLLIMLAMGASNWVVVRRLAGDPQPLLMRLRRFSEVEIGLGFTVILAAASMSAQAPAVDLSDQVSAHTIAARFHPRAPRLTSPTAAELTPPTSMEVAMQVSEFQATGGSDATDKKWSEYNHNWAGLIVLAAGLLALFSRLPCMRWARFGHLRSPAFPCSFCCGPTRRTGPWDRALSGQASPLPTFCNTVLRLC